MLSVAYLALVREAPLAESGAVWRDWYDFLPWEDWRAGRPELLDRTIAPALARWARSAPDRRQAALRKERVEIGFGLSGAPWDAERAIDRYEILYEAGLVGEAWRAGGGRGETSAEETVSAPDDLGVRLGLSMALDHRRILASALGRLRGKLRYRPVVFELLPPAFTLLALQRTVEALAGAPAAQTELPPPGRSRRPGRRHRAPGDAHPRPPGGALPLPPRRAARAPGTGSRPARAAGPAEGINRASRLSRAALDGEKYSPLG